MTAREIINKMLKYSKLNASAFSKAIGLERPQAIYDIQKGKTETISAKMADKILSVFPEVCKSWLLTGEGEMLKGTPSTDADIISLAGKNEFLMAYLQEKTGRSKNFSEKTHGSKWNWRVQKTPRQLPQTSTASMSDKSQSTEFDQRILPALKSGIYLVGA